MCYNEDMRNIKLTLAYNGTAYHGWQRQKNALTVQEVVERAVQKVTGVKTTVHGCGRTDAGVHAKSYAAGFRTASAVPCDRLPYALNTVLPEDIACARAEEMPPEFDVTRAKAKRYTYLVLNSDVRDVFMSDRAWQYKYPLDVEKMQRGAAAFLGEHDFIGFAASGFTVSTTVRTIYALDVVREGDIIRIEVTGNGFLYNMVRIIAGTLVFCGAGKIDAGAMPEIIASRQRSRAGITAPACGLYLSEVFY